MKLLSLIVIITLNLFINKTHCLLLISGKKFTENCRFCFKDGTCKRRQFMNQFCHVSQVFCFRVKI